MSRPDRMTQKAQEALLQARDLAARQGHPEITPEHLLLSLLDQEDGIVTPILTRIGVAPEPLRQAIRKGLERVPRADGGAEPRPAARLERLLEDAAAQWRRSSRTSTCPPTTC